MPESDWNREWADKRPIWRLSRRAFVCGCAAAASIPTGISAQKSGEGAGCLRATGDTRSCGSSLGQTLEVAPDMEQLVRALVRKVADQMSLGSADFSYDIIEDGVGSHILLPASSQQQIKAQFDLASLSAARAFAGDAGVQYIVGHELGHVGSIRRSPTILNGILSATLQIRYVELLADFASGHAYQSLLATKSTRSPVTRTIVATSDYCFDSADHHGTVFERTSAFGMGGFAAMEGYPLDFAKLAGRLPKLVDGLTIRRVNDAAELERQFRQNLEELYE